MMQKEYRKKKGTKLTFLVIILERETKVSSVLIMGIERGNESQRKKHPKHWNGFLIPLDTDSRLRTNMVRNMAHVKAYLQSKSSGLDIECNTLPLACLSSTRASNRSWDFLAETRLSLVTLHNASRQPLLINPFIAQTGTYLLLVSMLNSMPSRVSSTFI